MSKAKRAKRQARLLQRKLNEMLLEVTDTSEIFFRSLELKEKFDPHSRDKIRKDPCAYCGETSHDLRTVDHVTPKASGGSNSLSNLVSSCSECNNEKGSMSLLEYLLHRQLAAD